MILITSIICMALVYYLMDTGLALGFMSALFIEIFFLLALYNMLKNTEDKVKSSYDKIVDDYREREKNYLKIIEKAKEHYPDLENILANKKADTSEEPQEENEEVTNA